nr:60S acidic ribosomal protein P1-like [Leptinotarsa decemlineata]
MVRSSTIEYWEIIKRSNVCLQSGYLGGLRSSLGGWTQKVKSWYWGRPLQIRKITFNAELACVYSALVLVDDDIAVTGEKIQTILKAANVDVELYWPGLFAKALEGINVRKLITNIGSGVGSAPSPGGAAAPAAAVAAAAKPAKEEKKKEENRHPNEGK